MPVFTSPGGTPLNIDAGGVSRLRPSLASENGGHIGTTLFSPMQIVMEPVDVVGPALRAEAPGFTRLTGLSARRLWFNATRAGDARPPTRQEAQQGANAVVRVGGIGMKVVENVRQAQDRIDSARAAARG